ncbi:MAG: hypothetical protein HUU55_23690, partial [Myxococcales bacterium]|nr:hypothetical protein [Myxococcales bacterium]
VLEDTAPFVAPDSAEVVEILPKGVTPWANHVVVLADGAIHMEGGRSRIRVCAPQAAKTLIENRAEQLLQQTDLFDLLLTADRARRAPMRGTAFELIHTETKWNRLLQQIRRQADDPHYAGRIQKESYIELLQLAGVSEETQRMLMGVSGPTHTQIAQSFQRAQQANRDKHHDWISEAIESRLGRGWVEVFSDIVPFVPHDAEEISRRLPTVGWPHVVSAFVLADDSLHLDYGRTRTRIVAPHAIEPLQHAALTRLLTYADLYTLLDWKLRCEQPPPPRSLAAYIQETDDRIEALTQTICQRVRTPQYQGKVTKPAHLHLLVKLGFAEEAHRLAGSTQREWAFRSTKKPTAYPLVPRPDDQLATILAQRFRQRWVELVQDVVPYLPPTSPEIAELLPGSLTPWTRHIAILHDGSIHMEGGRLRILVCDPQKAQARLHRAATDALRGEDLYVLLDTLRMAQTQPRANTLCGAIAANPQWMAALKKQIVHVATLPRWAHTITRAHHVRMLSELGVDVSNLMSTKTNLRFPDIGRIAGSRPPRAERRRVASLEQLQSERIKHHWQEVEDDAVPYVDATDPRVRQLYRNPDPTHRFAALLDDGTIVYEGGTTRRWITKSNQALSVVARQAQRIIATAGVHWLLDLITHITEGRSKAAIHRWFREHPEWIETLRQRIVKLAADPDTRFTRPEHLRLLQELMKQ